MRQTIALGVLVTLSAAGHLRGEDACLDPAFGVAGRVRTSFTAEGDRIDALALQADGKVVAAGQGGSGPTLVSGMALARYDPDGSLDPAFGAGGTVLTNFSGDEDWAGGIALQPDGRILVSGFVSLDPGGSAVARYLPDGSLDTGFGAGGLVVVDFGSQADAIHAIALQPDGRIVVLATVHSGARWGLARLHPDGTLDPSFGTGGRVVTDIAPGFEDPRALALLPDGRILAAGQGFDGTHYRIALARYAPDGALDATFGAGGIVTTAVPGGDAAASAVAVLPDGRVLVGGGGPGAGAPDFGDLLLARYLPDGTLDPTFGSGGLVLADVGHTTDNGHALAVTPEGKILVAGSSWGATATDFVHMRFHADGGLDASYGDGGKVVTDFADGSDAAQDILLLPDGRIVLGGLAAEPGGASESDFALARYLPGCGSQPPRCASAVASPAVLPTDHRLREVTIGVEDPDGDPVFVTVTGITQDEPTRARPGDPAPDGFGIGTPLASLRAERDARGNGRVYAVRFEARDGSGAACSGQVRVDVPRDPRHGAIDDGQEYDSTSP